MMSEMPYIKELDVRGTYNSVELRFHAIRMKISVDNSLNSRTLWELDSLDRERIIGIAYHVRMTLQPPSSTTNEKTLFWILCCAQLDFNQKRPRNSYKIIGT